MKKALIYVYALFLLGTIFIFETIAKSLYPEWGGNPAERSSGMVIAIVFFLGYELYSWKSNLSEFLKRFLISIPFAMMFSVFAKMLGCDIYQSLLAGTFISILLFMKSPNWKKHFAVILTASCVFIVSAKLYFAPLDELQKFSFAKQALIFLGFMLTLSFFLLYLPKLLEQKKSPDLKEIVVRSVKFSITVSLFYALYLVCQYMGKRLEFNLPTQIFLNTIIAVIFLLIGYKFDLLLVERKKCTKKRNRSDQLQNKLNEIYLEERAKAKRNSIEKP